MVFRVVYYLLEKIKNKNVKSIIFIIFLLGFFIQSLPQFKVEEKIEYSFFYDYIDKESFKNIWITNPIYIVNSNQKARLVYYPSFDSARIKELREKMNNADMVFINTCDIPCPPQDRACFDMKPPFIEELKQRFKVLGHEKIWDCEKIILKD